MHSCTIRNCRDGVAQRGANRTSFYGEMNGTSASDIDRMRRRLLGAGALAGSALLLPRALRAAPPGPEPPAAATGGSPWLDVRERGAVGDGNAIDSGAINRAIDELAARGGGVVHVPAGTYACYSIRLKSRVSLYLDPGATLLAASVPPEGMPRGGYDDPEPQAGAWEPYQDFGHNHWRNSLIWGEGLRDIAIVGRGLIDGRALSRGGTGPNGAETVPGVGNKAIALKNCHNVLLRDFSILKGGWFALLATGVDDLTIDNLLVDTDRDGFDLDCCRNVRVSNCTVNTPSDDGICPKSSLALGFPRPSEFITIANCYVTGAYEVGSVLDGTWRLLPPDLRRAATGRIKCGTESNGGFKNITISDCVFDRCRGIALESVDGAVCEDITISGITMRGTTNCPIFLRLGRRMRAPAGAPIGSLQRILISGITSYDSSPLPSIIAGIEGHPVADIKISDVILHQVGGGARALARREPPQEEASYPEPIMFGELPATGFFIRHARNIEMSNVEIATTRADARPAFWLQDVAGADFFRMQFPGTSAYALDRVTKFRSFGNRSRPDVVLDQVRSPTRL
jgi:polygalacturonase